MKHGKYFSVLSQKEEPSFLFVAKVRKQHSGKAPKNK